MRGADRGLAGGEVERTDTEPHQQQHDGEREKVRGHRGHVGAQHHQERAVVEFDHVVDAAAGSRPYAAMAIFVDIDNPIAGQPVGGGVIAEAAIPHMTQAAFGGNPQ